jgi:hypothetical protein
VKKFDYAKIPASKVIVAGIFLSDGWIGQQPFSLIDGFEG